MKSLFEAIGINISRLTDLERFAANVGDMLERHPTLIAAEPAREHWINELRAIPVEPSRQPIADEVSASIQAQEQASGSEAGESTDNTAHNDPDSNASEESLKKSGIENAETDKAQLALDLIIQKLMAAQVERSKQSNDNH